MFNKTPVE